jgi:hypothetical protein
MTTSQGDFFCKRAIRGEMIQASDKARYRNELYADAPVGGTRT